jgi:hypothetical protein
MKRTVRAKVFAVIPELRMAKAETADDRQFFVSAKWHGDELFDSLTEGCEVELVVEEEPRGLVRVQSARLI